MTRPYQTNFDTWRAIMAANFVFVYYAVSNSYGRPAPLDFRVQRARRYYLKAVETERQLELKLREAA